MEPTRRGAYRNLNALLRSQTTLAHELLSARKYRSCIIAWLPLLSEHNPVPQRRDHDQHGQGAGGLGGKLCQHLLRGRVQVLQPLVSAHRTP